MVNIFQILKYQISFKILINKELVIDAYDQFLKDLKGNLIFQNLQSVDYKKKNLKFCVFSLIFFEYYLFSVLLRIKRAESPESQPDEPEFFSPLSLNKIPGAAQLFAADHVSSVRTCIPEQCIHALPFVSAVLPPFRHA